VTPQADPILDMFRATGAYLQGHFRLSSGLHSAVYLQCALVLQHPAVAEKLGRLLAEQLRALAGGKIDLVASPALGGLIIGHEVARALGVRFLFAERDAATKKMIFRRGFEVAPGEIAVVVEDVITTGGSTLDVIGALNALGADVPAAGCIIDRSGGHADLGVPRAALATLQMSAHYPEQCPLCAKDFPLVKPGSRPT
jgi:orotate phosphoribosyltransferase